MDSCVYCITAFREKVTFSYYICTVYIILLAIFEQENIIKCSFRFTTFAQHNILIYFHVNQLFTIINLLLDVK